MRWIPAGIEIRGAYSREEMADDNSLPAVSLEHLARPFEVRHEDELKPLEALDNTAQALLADPQSHGVQEERGRDRPHRRGRQHRSERELPLPNQKAREAEDQLRRDRQRVQVDQADQNGDANVAKGVHDVHGPLRNPR